MTKWTWGPPPGPRKLTSEPLRVTEGQFSGGPLAQGAGGPQPLPGTQVECARKSNKKQ
jgi:hypothetical protein